MTTVRKHKRNVNGKTVDVIKHQRKNSEKWTDDGSLDKLGLETMTYLEAESGSIKNIRDEGRGKYVETANAEYLVYDSEDDARRDAEERAEQDLDADPSMFNQDWLQNFAEVYPLDGEFIAQDLANSRTEDLSDREVQKELRDLKIEPFKGDYGAKEALQSHWQEEYESAIKRDAYKFFVEDEGLYTNEEYYKQTFVRIDTKKAAAAAVRDDGIAHFLAGYDGEEQQVGDKIIFRTN